MSKTHFTLFNNSHKASFSNSNFAYSFDKLFRWPKKKSYSHWQKLLNRIINSIQKKKFSGLVGGKVKRAHQKILQMQKKYSIKQKETRQENQVEKIIKSLQVKKVTETTEDRKLELITMLKLFWERKNIPEQIEQSITDYRNQELITYSKQSIMMATLSIFLFRMGSGNKYDDKSHDDDEKYAMANIAKFIDAPDERAPVIKTIEKFLRNLEVKNVNDIMIAFFQDLLESKFFKQHPEIMPGDYFILAADCVHTHTYDHPHHTDVHGNNDCECCLKRVYNRGTEKEKVKWMHNTLVFCFVFMGGLKIPVYQYPIHAKQVVNFESASEDNHKQECELLALKMALPTVRAAFPRMKLVLLLDGLYANRPVIRLAEEHNCGYIIVRKEECLTLLANECDSIAEQPNHKKNCVKKCERALKGGVVVEQKYEWFNSKYLGENVRTNVLRFEETRTKEGKEAEFYKCEWLFSWRLSAKSCESAVRQARARWEVEDLFNSLKNRGFNFKHDYSRNPRSCFNWQGLALFAFAIFELFRFSEVVKKMSDCPQITLAKKLEGQLFHRPTEEIFSKQCLSKRIQFRYNFDVNQTFFVNADSGSDDGGLRAA
jgi:hypothetical protein